MTARHPHGLVKARMSQREVAKRLGLSRNTVAALERSALNKLSAAYGGPQLVEPRKDLLPFRTLSNIPVKYPHVCANCSRVGHHAQYCDVAGVRVSNSVRRSVKRRARLAVVR